MSTPLPVCPPAAVRHAELTLKPGELRRHLEIKLGIAHLSAWVLLEGTNRPLAMVAYASAELAHCRLEHNCLWIGRSAAFDLTRAEAKRVRDTFGPHGLTMVLAP